MLKLFFTCLIILWRVDAFHHLGPMAASVVTSAEKISKSRLAMSTSVSETTREIYNIPNSGWCSDSWNWGYASGTGHDCAAICRKMYASRDDRQRLVSSLLEPVQFNGEHDPGVAV